MRGGKRSGAGRRKGAPNKATAARQAAISASGEAPLDYMIRVMRDKRAPVKRRDDMAKAAAPYVHPKLAAIEHAGTLSGKPPSQMTDEELIVIIREGQAQLAALNFDESENRATEDGRHMDVQNIASTAINAWARPKWGRRWAGKPFLHRGAVPVIRSRTRRTVLADHAAPVGVATWRAFSSAAICRADMP
jgi:hypothetical protein